MVAYTSSGTCWGGRDCKVGAHHIATAMCKRVQGTTAYRDDSMQELVPTSMLHELLSDRQVT
eukprot:2891883-Amphidinium_carterae.1